MVKTRHLPGAISDPSGIASRQVTVTRNGAPVLIPILPEMGASTLTHSAPATMCSPSRPPTPTLTGARATDCRPWPRLGDCQRRRRGWPRNHDHHGSLSDGGDNYFDWSVSDLSGISTLIVTISKEGHGQLHSSISPTSRFDLNPFGSGTYRIEIDATDNDADHAIDRARTVHQRTIVIADDDTLAPAIGLTHGSTDDGEHNFFAWSVTDSSGVFDADVTIKKVTTELYSNTYEPTGTFDLNTHGVGEFTIDIVAVDDDNDGPGDRLTATATRSTVIKTMTRRLPYNAGRFHRFGKPRIDAGVYLVDCR